MNNMINNRFGKTFIVWLIFQIYYTWFCNMKWLHFVGLIPVKCLCCNAAILLLHTIKLLFFSINLQKTGMVISDDFYSCLKSSLTFHIILKLMVTIFHDVFYSKYDIHYPNWWYETKLFLCVIQEIPRRAIKSVLSRVVLLEHKYPPPPLIFRYFFILAPARGS